MNARAPLFLFGQHLPFDGSSNRLRIILQKKKERKTSSENPSPYTCSAKICGTYYVSYVFYAKQAMLDGRWRARADPMGSPKMISNENFQPESCTKAIIFMQSSSPSEFIKTYDFLVKRE